MQVCRIRSGSHRSSLWFLVRFHLPAPPIYNSLPIPETKHKIDKNNKFTERPPETRWRDTAVQRKWRRSWTSNILIINVCAVFAWKTQSPDWFGHFIIAVTNIWDIIHSGLFTRYNTYRCVLFLITFIKEICLYLLTQHKEISHSFITSQSEEMDSDG